MLKTLAERLINPAQLSSPTRRYYVASSKNRPARSFPRWHDDAILACTSAVSAGCTRVGIQAPNDPSKIQLLVRLIAHLKPPRQNLSASRIVLLGIGIKDADRLVREVKIQFPRLTVEVEWKDRRTAGGNADITVTTIRNIQKEEVCRLLSAGMTMAFLMDDAHHATPGFWQTFMRHYDPATRKKFYNLPRHPHRPLVLGVSSDQNPSAFKHFEIVAFKRDGINELEEGNPLRLTRVPANLNLAKAISLSLGQLRQSELSVVMQAPEVIDLIIQTWISKAANRQTIVFCVDRSHADALESAFKKAGVQAMSVHELLVAPSPQDALQMFANTKLTVILASGSVVDWTKISNIECIILAAPTIQQAPLIKQLKIASTTKRRGSEVIVIEIVDHIPSSAYTTANFLNIRDRRQIEDASLADLRLHAEDSAINPINTVDAYEIVPSSSSEPTPKQPSVMEGPKYTSFWEQLRKYGYLQRTDKSFNVLQSDVPVDWIWCKVGKYVHDGKKQGYVIVEEERRSDDESSRIYRAIYHPQVLHDVEPFSSSTNRSEVIYEGDKFEKLIKLLKTFFNQSLRIMMKSDFRQTNRGCEMKQWDYIMKAYNERNAPLIIYQNELFPFEELQPWLTRMEASSLIARHMYAPEIPALLPTQINGIQARLRAGKTTWGIIKATRLNKRKNRQERKAAKKQRKRDLKELRKSKSGHVQSVLLARAARRQQSPDASIKTQRNSNPLH